MAPPSEPQMAPDGVVLGGARRRRALTARAGDARSHDAEMQAKANRRSGRPSRTDSRLTET